MRPPAPLSAQYTVGGISALACVALIAGSPAAAQTNPLDDETEAHVAAAAAQAGEAAAPGKKVDLLIAPVPFSSPATGAGLAGGAVAFYNPNGEPNQWTSGGGIVWTSLGTRGIAAFHSMSFGGDRVRIAAVASYFDARDNFYGIGAQAGDRGHALELANKRVNLRLQAQTLVFPHGYLGVQYRLVTADAKANQDIGQTPLPPPDQLNSMISTLGPQFAYDTRDSSKQPHKGVKLSASWMFGIPALGDDFNHNKLYLSGSAYFPFGSDTVFATNAVLCSAGGDVPFYDLCMFGSGNALRGYPSGRYRDRASWAVQGELRHRISPRWGGVAFFGYGGIAPSVGDFLSNGNVLPAAGIGARYRPFKNNDVHLRLDVAVGKNVKGVYLGIGEAF